MKFYVECRLSSKGKPYLVFIIERPTFDTELVLEEEALLKITDFSIGQLKSLKVGDKVEVV